MTLKEFKNLRKLRLILENDKRIWDLILFGSATRGKLCPRDFDLAVFFNCPIKLNEKLSISQRIREELGDKWQVIGIDLNDLVDGNFIGRTGIIAEGYSVRKDEHLSKLFGFTPTATFTYSLRNLSNSERTKLKYALSGRKKGDGLLTKWGGSFLGKGCISVPIVHMDELKELFESIKVNFQIKKTLVQSS